MRPFILTELQAGKLPRWGLLLLCALYVIPGLLGRDPWRVADAADFGVSYTLIKGHFADWLLPNLAGEPSHDRGPKRQQKKKKKKKINNRNKLSKI